MKMIVTLMYEYEIKPEDYPDQDPMEMAVLDIENDPAFILDTEWTITAASLLPDAKDDGE